MNEVDKFFDELPSEDRKGADVFNDSKEEKPVVKTEDGAEKLEDREARKNRRERRQDAKLEAKDAMIEALNDRVKQLSQSESTKFQSEFKSSGEVPSEWIALYGDSPEAKRAWQMNEVLLNKAKQEAKDEALKEFESRQSASSQAARQAEEFIDQSLEDLEDKYNVDLTSKAPAAAKSRREFLGLVEELSPKDSDGLILAYADFDKTFEIYQNSRKSEKAADTTNRQKELAGRSMNRGGGAAGSEIPEGPINFQTARTAIRKMLNS